MRATTHHRIRGVCAAACALPLLVLAGAAGASAAPAGPTFVQQGSAGEILSLENAARAQAGCPALSENGQLAQAAQAHSTDMATKGYFGHQGSDGSDVRARIARTGFSPNSPSEENISSGYPTAQATFDGWMNSAPHKAAILKCSWTQTGIASAQPGNLWTQVFAA
ncbi:CAP domain-containing protein [Kitasatospora sp. GP82]|uniref:CAP domain-containing protein n=1 Tax=Kitasatospora sp. GP82 TaxID=3035089 RepID=UPI002476B2AF|nr:CAP domain-containing protein [Kitasatospora sp. GP82]MDH6127365.1 uncharacterized protein YkwD [Kitasatospora sp. GP82]